MKRMLYKNQPVVTFDMVDALHERKPGHSKMMFYQNINRFDEDRHYIKTSDFCYTEELERNIENTKLNIDQSVCLTDSINEGTSIETPASKISHERILLTEKGYLLLVKPFTDERSWKIQDALIDDYFRLKQNAQLQLDYDNKINTLKITYEERLKRFESVATNLESRLIKYEPIDKDYMTVAHAHVNFGAGLPLKVFKAYLKRIEWPTKLRYESSRDGKSRKKVHDIYTLKLKDQMDIFKSQCDLIAQRPNVYRHYIIDGLFVGKF
jgi:hypothetical protein